LPLPIKIKLPDRTVKIHVTFYIVVTLGGQNFKLMVIHEFASPDLNKFRIKGKSGRYVLLEHIPLSGADITGGSWRVASGYIDNPPTDFQKMGLKGIINAISIYIAHRDQGAIIKGHSKYMYLHVRNKY
jgi:hypothetical protein